MSHKIPMRHSWWGLNPQQFLLVCEDTGKITAIHLSNRSYRTILTHDLVLVKSLFYEISWLKVCYYTKHSDSSISVTSIDLFHSPVKASFFAL